MRRLIVAGTGLLILLVVSGCSTVPLSDGTTLTSAGQLTASKGKFTKTRTFVDTRALAAVRTVAIIPTTFSFAASSRIKDPRDRSLVANALDRAVCVALSDRFEIAPAGQPADLTVRAVVAGVVPTNKAAAGVATAVSLGSSFALPVSVPRLPIGLGGLAVEAEAVDYSGTPRAAVLWSKGANSFTNKPRVSEVGDAYALANNFGKYFARMLSTGQDPKSMDLSLPSGHSMRSAMGGKPKYAACEAFGRAPGIAGALATQVGAPPQWTDKQPQPQR
ncbi:DUF3313 domain-containing protein [Agrobacterium sp. rho-8.1]|nr:DUF3313 domain-containing protein [Agrobacterium sp. rho-8.1]